MLISKVRLEEFKSYRFADLSFGSGTTAILGENGAGKSSILEAIGFAVFDHRKGTIANMLREGAREGGVEVTLSFGAGSYLVERRFNEKSTCRYRVYASTDPPSIVAEGVADVQGWLRKQLRVGPERDLATLFENTIGVVQGTLTAPFLLAPAQRKAVFDPLLRVEEYRKASDNLRETVRLLEDRRVELATEMARMEGELATLPALIVERDGLQDDLAILGIERETLARKLATLEAKLASLNAAEECLKAAQEQAKEAGFRKEAQKRIAETRLKQLLEAQAGKEESISSLVGHQAYLDAELQLQDLGASRQNRDGLLQECHEAMRKLDKAASVSAQLEEAEWEVDAIQGSAANIEKGRVEAGRVQKTIEALSGAIEALRAELQEFEQAQAIAQAEHDRISQVWETLRDESLAKCPTCGASLDAKRRRLLLSEMVQLLRGLGSGIERQSAEVRQRQQQIEVDEQQQSDLEYDLRQLPAPGMLELRQADLSRLVTKRNDLVETYAALGVASCEAELETARFALGHYAELDVMIERFEQQRVSNRLAHDTYMRNQDLATTLDDRECAYDAAYEEHQKLADAYDEATHDLAGIESQYDAAGHAQVRQQMSLAQMSLISTKTEMAQKAGRLNAVAQAIGVLEAKQGELGAKGEERQETEELHSMVEWVRGLLREAGPYVTRRLVWQVSQHASELFADLMGDPGTRLSWSEDYETRLQAGSYIRVFSQLSGGEQMAAAIALRLALLRETSGIDVAFFDEPTAHLDPQRRESLAERIGQVRGFSQMFVISHDSTFDAAVQNVIRIEKDQDGSHVVAANAS